MGICNVVWLLSRQRTSHNGIYEYFIPVATKRLQHKVCLKYHIFVVVVVLLLFCCLGLMMRQLRHIPSGYTLHNTTTQLSLTKQTANN